MKKTLLYNKVNLALLGHGEFRSKDTAVLIYSEKASKALLASASQTSALETPIKHSTELSSVHECAGSTKATHQIHERAQLCLGCLGASLKLS